LVSTEAYAEATAVMLDTWLTASGPFRKALATAMSQVLTNSNLPTRDQITSLAERLTNIEIRLDDLEAKLDESHRAARKTAGAKTRANAGEASP
jgi:hypothetical protein